MSAVAGSNPTTPDTGGKPEHNAAPCALCGDPATKTCSVCGTVKYCSTKCQGADWKQHKPLCGCNRCGKRSTPLSACACGGRLCAPCHTDTVCVAVSTGRLEECPICFDPLRFPRGVVKHLCGHDVCSACYTRLANSGTNPDCSVCRRRSMAFGSEPETPSVPMTNLLERLQVRLCRQFQVLLFVKK